MRDKPTWTPVAIFKETLSRDIAGHGDPLDFGGRETNYGSLFRASDKEVS